ncbi:MAG: peptide deformylase [Planctomycetales bacterium]|nr:peptide deformylase [Planctomycetales bacterium]
MEPNLLDDRLPGSLRAATVSLQIIHYPHSTLRFKSVPVMRVDAELKNMAAEMLELMYEAEGVGLAANQVNIPLRFFVCNPTGQKGEPDFVFINPIISKPKGNAVRQEGCLSIPGLYEDVRRPDSIHVEAYDLSGNEINMDLKGFFSRVVQHETDHLDGVLFIDRLSETARADVDGDLCEFELAHDSAITSGNIPSEAELEKHRLELTQRYG